jgi:hypothetical protein
MALSFHKFAMPVVAGLALGLVAMPAIGQDEKPVAADDPAAVKGKPIDLVLCLDVSGSMSGLIDSAKIRLWEIVNELARLKPTPDLRVALYSYGASGYPADKGWVRKEIDLTVDLDEVYRVLNALSTGGGEELVARVSTTAIDEQKWSEDKDALRMLFVAGNEGVDQDKEVSLDVAAAKAKKAGVIVNTIYCRPDGTPEAKGWSDFAVLAGGKYMNIDMNRAVNQVVVKTEYDEKIVQLGVELNKTYVSYGERGEVAAANQVAQDENAVKAKGAKGGAATAALGRAVTKANALYNCAAWDLVDKMKEKGFDITKIPEDQLCEELKKIKPEERLAYLKKKAGEREKLQKEINDLSAKRQKKIEEERAKLPRSDAEKALDEAVKSLIREQAKAKGFSLSDR